MSPDSDSKAWERPQIEKDFHFLSGPKSFPGQFSKILHDRDLKLGKHDYLETSLALPFSASSNLLPLSRVPEPPILPIIQFFQDKKLKKKKKKKKRYKLIKTPVCFFLHSIFNVCITKTSNILS